MVKTLGFLIWSKELNKQSLTLRKLPQNGNLDKNIILLVKKTFGDYHVFVLKINPKEGEGKELRKRGELGHLHTHLPERDSSKH